MNASTTTALRLLLVDDHQVVRIGLRTLLNGVPGIEVVGEAATVAQAVEQASALAPDIVLLDVRLPDGTGFEACRKIRLAGCSSRVLMLTSFAEEDAIRKSIEAGAHGYLLKEADGEALVRAIRDAAAGRTVLDPAVTDRVFELLRKEPEPAVRRTLDLLSPQEQRVLAQVAEGKTNKEIAEALGLSPKTVKNYLSNLMEKLQFSRRSQAAAFYSRQGRPLPG